MLFSLHLPMDRCGLRLIWFGTILGELFLLDTLILLDGIFVADCLRDRVEHCVKVFVVGGWHLQVDQQADE